MLVGIYTLVAGKLSYQNTDIQPMMCERCHAAWVHIRVVEEEGASSSLPLKADGVLIVPHRSKSGAQWTRLFAFGQLLDVFFPTSSAGISPDDLREKWWQTYRNYFDPFLQSHRTDPLGAQEYSAQTSVWQTCFLSQRHRILYLGEVFDSFPQLASTPGVVTLATFVPQSSHPYEHAFLTTGRSKLSLDPLRTYCHRCWKRELQQTGQHVGSITYGTFARFTGHEQGVLPVSFPFTGAWGSIDVLEQKTELLQGYFRWPFLVIRGNGGIIVLRDAFTGQKEMIPVAHGLTFLLNGGRSHDV